MIAPLPADDPRSWKRALEQLRGGGVVVLPTDTLYGLHAVASEHDAVERIARLKGIDPERPFVHLAAEPDDVWRRTGTLDAALRERLARVWPAPVTVILLAPAGGGERRALAWRVPDHDDLRALIARVGQPLVSTSVNRSGEDPFTDPRAIADAFDVDLVLDGGPLAGDASTILDGRCCPEKVVRAGRYDWAAATGDSNPSK